MKPEFFFDFLFPTSLAALAIGGSVRALRGLVEDYHRRCVIVSAARPSGKFGNADFATLEERLDAGLHDGSGFALLGLSEGLPCTVNTVPAVLAEAVSGSGKTSSLGVLSIWQSLHTGRSCFVSDPKPEYVWMLADALRKRGFRVAFNNPARVQGLGHDDFNPFHILVVAVRSPQTLHEAFLIAETLAKVIVPDVDDGKSRYFTQIDQQVLIFVQVALAILHPKLCYPAQIYRHLVDPDQFEELLFEAKRSIALRGDLASLARALIKKDLENPEHLEGARTGASNGLSWAKPSSSLGHLGSNHSYDAEEARDPDQPPLIVFDIAPPDQLTLFSRPYELITTARLLALKRKPDGREVIIVADEYTIMPIRPLCVEIEYIRSFNIRVIAAFQSWSSLKRVYGEARAETLRANSAQLYFSVNDMKTAREISERIGETTIKTESIGFSEAPKASRTVSETGRKVMPPEKVLSRARGKAVMVMPGLPPVDLDIVPYYKIAPIKDLLGDNPHERHQKSPVTSLTMLYGKDVSELGLPTIPDMQARLQQAQNSQSERNAPAQVRLVRPYKLIWIPLGSVDLQDFQLG